MIARLEEKASADATHNAFEAKQINLRAFDPKLVVYFSSRSRPEVMNIHPYAPASNTIGHRGSPTSLEAYPCKTGFDACSLQPTNGASGEYAGLLVIRKYQENIRQGYRNVCIIPRSAHGMNPDSALMPHISMKIKWIDDSQGVPLEEFMRIQHRNHEAAIYQLQPSQAEELRRIRQETEDTRRTEHMRSRMDLLYRRSLQFLPLDEHFAIRSAVMTTSDRWVILDNGSRMLEVTTKECHGQHHYERVSLEGGTSSQSSFRRTMARINSWYNFQADEMYVSRVINQRTVQVVLTGTFDALGFSHISVPLNVHKLAPDHPTDHGEGTRRVFEHHREPGTLRGWSRGSPEFTSQGEQVQRSGHR